MTWKCSGIEEMTLRHRTRRACIVSFRMPSPTLPQPISSRPKTPSHTHRKAPPRAVLINKRKYALLKRNKTRYRHTFPQRRVTSITYRMFTWRGWRLGAQTESVRVSVVGKATIKKSNCMLQASYAFKNSAFSTLINKLIYTTVAQSTISDLKMSHRADSAKLTSKLADKVELSSTLH